jgi:hypothetical protein
MTVPSSSQLCITFISHGYRNACSRHDMTDREYGGEGVIMKRSSRHAGGESGSGPGFPGIPPASGGEGTAPGPLGQAFGRRGFLVRALLGGPALGTMLGLTREASSPPGPCPHGREEPGRSGDKKTGPQEEEMIIEL